MLHYTAMNSASQAVERLCDPAYEVSAHYLIDAQGSLISMVDEKMRAWHAGAGKWQDVQDMNSRSIGIELANTGMTPFSEPQMAKLEELLEALLAKYSLPIRRVIGHSDFAPERKSDPGRHFDWKRLARSNLAFAPNPAMALCEVGAEVCDRLFTQNLSDFGYQTEIAFDILLDAFRQRFHQSAYGKLNSVDMAISNQLLQS